MTTRMLSGPSVVRIEWLPGTDTLLGTCHCSARHEADDPVQMWDWLLAHPNGHHPGTDPDSHANPAAPARVPVPV